MVIALRPFRVLDRGNTVPQFHGVRSLGTFGRVGIDVMPCLVLQRDRKDIHDRMIKRFAAGGGIHLLRIAGPGANYVVGMMAGLNDDVVDGLEIRNLRTHLARQVDQRLALVFRRVFLGIGF